MWFCVSLCLFGLNFFYKRRGGVCIFSKKLRQVRHLNFIEKCICTWHFDNFNKIFQIHVHHRFIQTTISLGTLKLHNLSLPIIIKLYYGKFNISIDTISSDNSSTPIKRILTITNNLCYIEPGHIGGNLNLRKTRKSDKIQF